MPTIQFKGKSVIWNHHLSVPYHTLEEDKKLSFQPEKGEGNLIIEGDNLIALKALLPEYSGKIKCIYIDPPYNTGDEGWVYNDNVNSPLIKDWIGKEVGRDDLTRHDKWLCMMTPRLKVLRELLSDDGAIFISIDDNEQHHLRQLASDVFGEDNFVAVFPWRKRTAKSDVPFRVSQDYEWILCFAKSELFSASAEGNSRKYYESPDLPNRPWRVHEMTTHRTAKERHNSNFTIVNPKNGDKYPVDPNAVWRVTRDSFKKFYKEKRIVFPGDYDFLNISKPVLRYFLDEDKAKAGDEFGFVSVSTNLPKGVGMTQDGTKDIGELFSDKVFAFPKPVNLIRYLVEISTSVDKSATILDSFAGSGTTMQAVMDLNEEDEGQRKCIMVQMSESTGKEPKKNICRDITQERIRRAIKKNGYESGFKYFRVGEAIDAETMLSGKLPTYIQLAKYAHYLCTGSHVQDEKKIDEKTYFVGSTTNERIYLIYDNDYEKLVHLALNLDLAERFLKESTGKKIVVYAPACFLEEEYMAEKRIEFVSIPYNLFTKNK
jgi:adenine-specific DNA-methyltransferase